MRRPPAWCPACLQQVADLQVFKDSGCDMSRYGQYWYRCPHRTCRNTIVDPQCPLLPRSSTGPCPPPG
jgi:DNA (cytosine-5)-methyltransferase 1